jgi:hypothetical protein
MNPLPAIGVSQVRRDISLSYCTHYDCKHRNEPAYEHCWNETIQNASDASCSRVAEVAARPAVANLERGLVLENKPFNDATILNGMNGAPVHKHARALVGEDELHQ